MGAADGAVFAPAKPGSKPIEAAPCKCPECKAGPGVTYKSTALAQVLRAAGVDLYEMRFCIDCRDMVLVISARAADGMGWTHICKQGGHMWATPEMI